MIGRVVRTAGDDDAARPADEAAGFALAAAAVVAGFAGRLAVASGLFDAVVAGFEVEAAAAAFGVVAAVAGLVEPAGFDPLAAGDFVLAAGDPAAVVRARVTFGFGLAAGWPGVAGLGVGSGREVGSAMCLA